MAGGREEGDVRQDAYLTLRHFSLCYGASLVDLASWLTKRSPISSDTHCDRPSPLPILLRVAYKSVGPGIKSYRLLRDRVLRQKFRGLRCGT